MQRKEVFGPMS